MKKIKVQFVHGKFGIYSMYHKDLIVDVFQDDLDDFKNINMFRNSPRVIRACREALGHNPDEIILLGWREFLKSHIPKPNYNSLPKYTFSRVFESEYEFLNGGYTQPTIDLETGICFGSAIEAIESLNLTLYDRNLLSKRKHKRLKHVYEAEF